MLKILEKMYASLAVGAVLALVVIIAYHGGKIKTPEYWPPFFTFLHVLSAITWIGLLYYFNLVQTPMMAKIPADLKPGVSKYIAPEALFWFRWSALSTVAFGLLIAFLKGYGHQALTLQHDYRTIGTGMWLGLIMAFNVWFIIWPNQKKVLGIVKAEDAAKAKAGKAALYASRTNFILSIPMLYCMIGYGLLG